VTSLSGEEAGDYYPPITAIGDVSTGVHAYAAVATALLYRERTGKGQHTRSVPARFLWDTAIRR